MNIKDESVVIIDKKGKSYVLSDQIDQTESNKFYIFIKNINLNLYDNILKTNVELTTKQINMFYTPSFITNLPIYNFKDLNIDDIECKQLFEKIQEAMDYFKDSFKKLKVNIRVGEKLKDNMNNQSKANSVLIYNLESKLEFTENNYSFLKKKLDDLIIRNDQIVSVFDSSIEILKKYEIHPVMKDDKQQYLIDIYFPEDKMISWKDRCEKNQKIFQEKIYKKKEILNSISDKLQKEKANSFDKMKLEIKEKHTSFDSFINEKEKKFVDILNEITKDYKTIYKLFQEGDAQNAKKSKEFLELKCNYLNNGTLFTNYIKEKQQIVTNFVKELEEEVKKIKNLITKNMNVIATFFENFYQVKNELSELITSFNRYENGLKRIEEDFNYLSNPSMFPEAYKQSIPEVRRRIIFNKKINLITEKIQEMIVRENEQRKKFISNLGIYLTNDYIPSLKFVDVKFSSELINNDELIDLPNILVDSDYEELLKFNSIIGNINVQEISIENSNENNLSSNLINNREVDQQIEFNLLQDISSIEKLISKSQENENNQSENVEANNIKIHDSSILKIMNDKLRILKNTIAETELRVNIKFEETKKLKELNKELDKKLISVVMNTESILEDISKMNDNFLKQISLKDLKIAENNREINNLVNSKLENDSKRMKCIMCVDQLKNNIEYQSWNSHTHKLNDDLMKLKRENLELENSNKEMSKQLSYVKKNYLKFLSDKSSMLNLKEKNLTEEYMAKLSELNVEIESKKEKLTLEYSLKESLLEKQISELKYELSRLKKDNEIKNILNSKLQEELIKSSSSNKEILENNIETSKSLKKLKEEFREKEENYKLEIQNLKDKILISMKEDSNLVTDLKKEVLRYTDALENKNQLIADLENNNSMIKNENLSLRKTLENLAEIKNAEFLKLDYIIKEQEKKNSELLIRLEECEEIINNLKSQNIITNSINQNSQILLTDTNINNLNQIHNQFTKNSSTRKSSMSSNNKINNLTNNQKDLTAIKILNTKDNKDVNEYENSNKSDNKEQANNGKQLLYHFEANTMNNSNNMKANDKYKHLQEDQDSISKQLSSKPSLTNESNSKNENEIINKQDNKSVMTSSDNKSSKQEILKPIEKLNPVDNIKNNIIDFQNMLSIQKIEVGSKVVFIPFSESIYVPLIFNYENKNSIKGKKSFECKYLLNLNCLDENIKDLVV